MQVSTSTPLHKGDPSGAPILVSGRSHYFDSRGELEKVLGIDQRWIHLTLSDFTDEQIQSYLLKKGFSFSMPRSLPARPLLIGYLASRDLLKGLVNPDEDQSSAIGWDRLLQHVCAREVDQIEPGFAAEDLRAVIERLATKARTKASPIGPLTGKEIIETFKEVLQYEPEEKSYLELLRLPGLCGGSDPAVGDQNTAHRQDDHVRQFIDEDFANVAAAGDVARFLESPFDFNTRVVTGCRHVLGNIGISIVAQKCKDYSEGNISAALKHLNKKEIGCVVVADTLKVMIENGVSYVEQPIRITDLVIDDLAIGSRTADYSRITLEDCYISRLDLWKKRKNDYLPNFVSSLVGVVYGVDEREHLPSGKFHPTCEFDGFVDTSVTIADVTSLELPRGLRILGTVLHKLFVQNGPKPRSERTLFNACELKGQESLRKVLDLLEREGIVRQTRRKGQRSIIPDKRAADRV